MTFAAPLVLLALLLVAAGGVLYALAERRRGRGRQAWATPALLPSVAPGRPGRGRHVGPVLYLLAAAVLVVAIARPEREVDVPVEEATVMLVTDRSGSMRATDVAPDRMEAAKRAAGTFLDDVPRDVRVGAIAFNHKVRLLVGPTTDRARVRRQIGRLDGRGSTAAGDALSSALATLRPEGDRAGQTPAAIVLLSDGETVRGQDPVEVARRAGELGVRIFTVSVGTDEGTLTSRRADGTTRTERVPPDRDALRQIAEASDGTFADAPTAEALRAAYEELGSKVSTRPGTEERTALVVGGALVLLVLGAGLSLRLTGRLV